MSVEDLIKDATRTFSAQLQQALEAMAADMARAAADDRDAAVARATEALERQLAEARSGAKADIERAVAEEVERARAEVEEAALAKIAEARAEAQQAADARVDAVRDEARDEAQKSAEAQIARVRSEAEASVELARARAATEAEAAAASTVTDVVAGERQHQLLCSERLLGVIRKLDAASSLTDVLAILADGAAAEAPRVAVLTLQGQRVRGWRFLGFSPAPATVDLDLAEAGVIGRAVRAGEAAFAEPAAPGHPEPAGPAFAALPPDRSGLALPLIVGGATVAVLYADDVTEAEHTKPASWPEAIEILGRHAAVRLENLTAVRTAQVYGRSSRPRESTAGGSGAAGSPGATDEDEGARRYARLLVSEIKLYNESAVRVGRQKRDIGERLRAEIARARQLYEDRVPPAVRARRDYFDEELVQTLAGGDAALLGRRSDALA